MKSFKPQTICFSKIKNIKSCGEQQTYDIEMKQEPYNFIANGFISHNSHSCAYTIVAWQMATLKCYYRKYFNLAVLNMKDDEDKIQQTIDDCYDYEIPIKNFFINDISNDFTLNDKGEIIPGSRCLKGIGDKTLQTVIEKKPYKDAQDFLTRSKIRTNSLETLVKYDFFLNEWGKDENAKIKEYLKQKNKQKTKKDKTNEEVKD
jgi:DNA polymerase-3 subunit alpha